jgi:hypothetical protein
MASDDTRKNFYIILGISPDEPWDEALYKRLLSEKRNEWSRLRNGIKAAPRTVDAQRNLAMHGEIQRVMADPRLRETERLDAIRQRASEMGVRRRDVADRASLMLRKGYLFQEEYDELIADEAVLADDGLRELVESAERRPSSPSPGGDTRLDAPMEQNLRQYLVIVGQPDLYAALRMTTPAVSEETPAERLLEAADELSRKARNTANKNLPEVGAMQQLGGLARAIFSSPDLKRRHDATVRLWSLDVLLDRYEGAMETARAIDARQFESFLHDAAEKGIGLTVARDALIARFSRRGWRIDMPSAEAQARVRAEVRCPRCSRLNDPDAAHCARCGRALRSPCPRCGTAAPGTQHACPACGFPVGERDYVEFLADEVEASLEKDDLSGAAEYAAKARLVWQLPKDSPDELAARLSRAREQIDAQRAALRERIDQVNVLMETRSFRAAARLLRGVAARHPSAPGLLVQCEDAIADSGRRFADARAPGLPNAQRAQLYHEALQLCADNDDARRELSRIPPTPPRVLRATPHPERGVIRLTWEAAPEPGCVSVVVRADGIRPPASASGPGRHVVHGQGAWEDTSPLIGLPMSYAVYTERDTGGAISERPAVLDEPVLLAVEARLAAVPGDRKVELSWELPPNATGVELRKEEVATGTGRILLPPAGGVKQRTDQQVSNGVRYRYTAVAVFAVPLPGRGERVWKSRSVSCDVTPTIPPSLPGPVSAAGRPPGQFALSVHEVKLDCPSVERGEVKIVVTGPGDGRPPRPGAQFHESELGTAVGHNFREPGEEDIWWMDQDWRQYTPVLVLNGRCYVGESRWYVRGPEVCGLLAEHKGTWVRVTWTWPDEKDITEALVAWRDSPEIGDPVNVATRQYIPRLAGADTGQCDIPASRRVFVKVAVVRKGQSGDAYITSGAQTDVRRPKITLRYEVSRRGKLVLHCDHLEQLPDLVLYGRLDDLPTGRGAQGDKKIVAIPAGRAKQEIPSPLEGIKPRSCRLFVTDDLDGDAVQIIHPNLRLLEQVDVQLNRAGRSPGLKEEPGNRHAEEGRVFSLQVLPHLDVQGLPLSEPAAVITIEKQHKAS